MHADFLCVLFLSRTLIPSEETSGVHDNVIGNIQVALSMEQLTDLKAILHSKRANIYYLQYCRVLVNGGRVEYVTDEGKRSLYWNIPIANTTCILLGTGTSVTQAAMREFARAGVLVGFSGGSGTPLFAGTEVQIDITWLEPQSEYRAPEYLQQWVSFWFDEQLRTEAARQFQHIRLEQIRKHWLSENLHRESSFEISKDELSELLDHTSRSLTVCQNCIDILSVEARLTKSLYRLASRTVSYGEFRRAKRGGGMDYANRFLDHGNYLAYGLGATAAWVLGLPYSLAVLHGKTRRGGLVFDIADLVKDALVLPQAFIASMAGDDETEFRQRCTVGFQRAGALDVMIDSVKSVAADISLQAKARND